MGMWVQCVRYQMGHMGNWHYLMAPLASQFKHMSMVVVIEPKMLIFNALTTILNIVGQKCTKNIPSDPNMKCCISGPIEFLGPCIPKYVYLIYKT